MCRILLMCFTIVALAAGSASAGGDFCITETDPPSFQYVTQKFSIPGRGKCKPWLGYMVFGGETFPSTGTACTATSGTHLSISISTTPVDGFADADHAFFDVSLPSLTVTKAFESELGAGTPGVAAENSGFLTTVSAGPCPLKRMPIP